MANDETKKCKKCGMDIAKNAKICPHCRSKQNKHTFLKILFVLVVIFIIIGIASTSGGSSSSSSAVSEAETKMKAMTVDEMKSVSENIDYDGLKRNPESNEGLFITKDIVVVQKVSDTQWRAFEKDDGEWNFLGYDADKEFLIFDKRKDDLNIIEDDKIRVFGVYRGTVEVTRGLTRTKDKVPTINIYALELLK